MPHVDLPDSERLANPDATITGPAYSEEQAMVTVIADAEAESLLAQFGLQYDLSLFREHGLFKLTGRVSDLEHAFHVTLHKAELPDGTSFRSRVPAGMASNIIQIPSELAPHVKAVLGLDTRPQAEPHFRRGVAVGEAATPAFSTQQIAQMYDFPSDVKGEGQCIAIIELGGGFSAADCTAAGLDPSLVIAQGVDGASNSYSGDPNSADGEVALDIQVIGQVAPKCKQIVYFTPNTDAGFLDAIAAAANDTANKPCAISISWGSAEANWTQQAMKAMDHVFQQAASNGIPVWAASGDNGSSDGGSGDNVDFPASGPNCMGCGGTILPSIAQEKVWNDSGGGAGGGGVSKVFSKPAYQSNISWLTMRGVPDVAGDASPQTGYSITINGQRGTFGGTSAVAPLWTAFTALATQKLGKHLGDLHTQLYPLIGTPAFHDITQGNNGSQQAKVGYDTCTGCGTPDGAKLITALGGTSSGPTLGITLAASPTSVNTGQPVAFTASPNGVPTGATPSYIFDFGDSMTTPPTASPTVSHMYSSAGAYTAKVTVTAGGQTATASMNINVSQAGGTAGLQPQIDAAIAATIATLQQYEQQDATNSGYYRYAILVAQYIQQNDVDAIFAAGGSAHHTPSVPKVSE